MTHCVDISDVPAVEPQELALAMRFMIETEKGLVLLRGASAADLEALETAIWDSIDGDMIHRRAVLLRFRALVDVFSARRLRALMLRRGYNLIGPALRVAAAMRLNIRWGFSPQKFCVALHRAQSAPALRPVAPAPAAGEGPDMQAAA